MCVKFTSTTRPQQQCHDQMIENTNLGERKVYMWDNIYSMIPIITPLSSQFCFQDLGRGKNCVPLAAMKALIGAAAEYKEEGSTSAPEEAATVTSESAIRFSG